MSSKQTKVIEQDIATPIQEALQGLAFWVSYRQVLYDWYLINEGALVTEFVNLLNAKLDKSFKVFCELQYYETGKGKERMDVGILKKDTEKKVAVIEVKRYFFGKKCPADKRLTNIKHIHEDMEKLSRKMQKDKSIRYFLIVVSEDKLPEEFVTDKGFAKKANVSINSSFSADVTRVLKSAKSFRGKKKILPNANYCCLIEINPLTKISFQQQ